MDEISLADDPGARFRWPGGCPNQPSGGTLDGVSFERRRFEEIDAELAAKLAQLEAQTAGNEQAGDIKPILEQLRGQLEELSRQHQHLAADRARIASHKAELDMAREQLARQRQKLSFEFRRKTKKLAGRSRKIAAQAAKLRELEEALADTHESQQHEADTLARRRSLLNERQTQLERDDLLLETKRRRTAAQRLRIAARLKVERDESLRLRRAFTSGHGNEEHTTDSSAMETASELAKLREENASLASHVHQLESRLAENDAAPSDADSQQLQDLQRRFEMAVDDVRELKRRNAELEETLAKRPVVAADSGSIAGQSWEETKRRMLSQLAQESGELTSDERLTVEATIRITDEVIHQKEQEIATLKEQLAKQSSESRDVRATAAEGVLSHDAAICRERERLAGLEAHWQEMIRQAEVELSVERANIARERAALDERARALEAQSKGLESPQEPPSKSSKSKKQERRWLDRLGLKEQQ